MDNIFFISKLFLVNSYKFLREWFDPAYEASPYQEAMRQPKIDRVDTINRYMPRRRIAIH